MKTVKVKAFKRKGKIVKAHTRVDRRTVKNFEKKYFRLQDKVNEVNGRGRHYDDKGNYTGENGYTKAEYKELLKKKNTAYKEFSKLQKQLDKQTPVKIPKSKKASNKPKGMMGWDAIHRGSI